MRWPMSRGLYDAVGPWMRPFLEQKNNTDPEDPKNFTPELLDRFHHKLVDLSEHDGDRILAGTLDGPAQRVA